MNRPAEPSLESRAIQIVGEILDHEPTRHEELVANLCRDPELALRVRALLVHAVAMSDFLQAPLIRPDIAVHRGMAPGTSVGRYTIAEWIGSGSMGDVYRAHAPGSPDGVALKVVRPGVVTPELSRRFEFEISSLTRLRHPNIARLIDSGIYAGEDGQRPFLVMPLVNGGSITAYALAHSLPLKRRVELVLNVCDAVEHAHRVGIIHRDLKPANILIDTATAEAIVVDFGVARAIDPEATLSSMPGERLIGSLPYMSPEQAAGKQADTRSDVYALGAVLFELVCGRPPHVMAGRPLAEVLRGIQDHECTRARSLVEGLDRDLDVILTTATTRQPNARYQSAAALAEDLRLWLAGRRIQAREASAWQIARSLIRRYRAPLLAGIFVLTVIGSAGVIALVMHLRTTTAEARTQLLLDEVVLGSRAMLVDLNQRLIREKQPLEARQAVAEATRDYVAKFRLRAGDDPKVLEALADTSIQLASIIGGAGDASLARYEPAKQLFTQSEEILTSLLRDRPDPRLYRKLARVHEELGILTGDATRFESMARCFRAAAAVLPPGAERDDALRLAGVATFRVATMNGDIATLRQSVEFFTDRCESSPQDAERWSDLALAQRLLSEHLLEDPQHALPVLRACERSLERAIALGGPTFSNERHAALNALNIVHVEACCQPPEALVERALGALRRSRLLLLQDPSDNMRRFSHCSVTLSFVRNALHFLNTAPRMRDGSVRRELAERLASAVRDELKQLDSLESAAPPHMHEAEHRKAIEEHLAELERAASS